jgi:hydroxysqualene dehydroxylase
VTSADVVVIGAGCAGLAAASRLAELGAKVLVVERAPRLGGRAAAFTDRVTGDRVDNGQHVLFGCYHETYALLARVETSHLAPLAPNLQLPMIGPDGRRADLVCPNLAPPWHLVGGLARWKALSILDRVGALRIGRVVERARRVGAEKVAATVPADVTVEQWLAGHGQSSRINDWLWHPLTLAALNQSPRVVAAAPFVRVLGELFGPRREDAAVALSRVPLDELYAEPARRFIEARGGSVRMGAKAVVDSDGHHVRGVWVDGAKVAAASVISAVPWYAFGSVWSASVPAPLAEVAANAERLASAPIVTVNLWLDGPVMPVLDVPFVGLVDAPVHWVFDKARIGQPAGRHLALVTSGAEALVTMTHDEAVRTAFDCLRTMLPEARHRSVRHAVVVRERRATFSLAPGGPPRPTAETPIRGLYLAGDWTDTGLPATIEGAVKSGHTAASLVARA